MRVLAAALLTVTVACASTGEGSTGDSDVLTLDQISGSSATDTYSVIRDLRPQWLRVRGPVSFSGPSPIVIYVDGARAGGLEILDTIPVAVLEEIRYHPASEARARLGSTDDRPVIAIRTNRG